MTSADVEVRAVRTAADWRRFHALRRTLYRDDPVAVLPLLSEQHLQVDTGRNPFWQHAEREAFVALRNGRVAGRVAAIIDHLHNDYYGDRTGFFGFFECEDDPTVARRLLESAAGWLVERGRDRMRGPVNPSLKGEFGVLVKGNDLPPAVMMSHTPAWYERLILGAGRFTPVHDVMSLAVDLKETMANHAHWKMLVDMSGRILKRHPELSLRAATRANVAETITAINRLANEVRRTVWGFVPLTDAELDFLAERLKRVVLPEFLITVRREEEIVGFVLAVPDVNWALKRARGTFDLVRMIQLPFLLPKIPRLRVFALGADARYRAAGILPLLFHAISSAAVARFKDFELGWFSETNLMSFRSMQRVLPVEPAKIWRLYDAPLPLA